MTRRRNIPGRRCGWGVLAFMALTMAATDAMAQATAPGPLAPAPVLGTAKDAQGRPLPFGVPRYVTPETPLGTGPYKAVMATDSSLPDHVLYYPANIDAAGKLPIVSWGNGACIHAGNRFRGFLTEIASHGFLVISAGTIGHVALEVGPQENPVVRRPGESAPPPAPAPPIKDDPTASWRATRSTADHLKQAIDWAIAENGRSGSKFFGKIDTAKIAVAGQSCGGGLATQVASDPRITAVGMFNSGTRLTPQAGSNTDATAARATAVSRLDAIHTPILYITGDAELDTAFSGARESFTYLTKVPAIWVWQEGLAHIGTYGAPGGGSIGQIATAWFKWQLKGDAQAARMFQGEDCTLCRTPSWHVQRKNMK